MTAKKPRSAPGVAADWASPGSPHELDELHLTAHGMVNARPDLRPSIARIISADLDSPAQGMLRVSQPSLEPARRSVARRPA